MKKTYMAPTMEIFKTQGVTLLAGSEQAGVYSDGKASEWGARDFDFDDED